MLYSEVKVFIEAGNYFIVPNDVMDWDLSPAAFMVFFYLCKCSDEFGCSFPSRKTIGKNCGHISVVTVDKALKELEEWGLVRKRHQFNDDHKQLSNEYVVTDLIHRKLAIYQIKQEIEKKNYA